MSGSFSSSFAEARARFLAAARDAGAEVFTYGRDDLKGRDGEYLACDVAVLGDRDAPAAALVIAGTHGNEGPCGSAIQHRWLAEGAGVPRGVKVVLVHAISPWAYSHGTRATENNVDLNRNFHAAPEGFARANPSYDRLVPFLHGPAGTAAAQFAAYRDYRAFLDRNGWNLETESVEGQSTWPDGIFYTGTGPEWSNAVFRTILREHLAGAARIGFIDWHTGIGQYGEVVPLVFDAPGSEAHAEAVRWWRIGGGADSAFGAGAVPRYEGLLCRAIGQELPEARVAGAVIEFGVADDYSIFRSDRLDRWLRFEGRDDPDQDRLRADCLNITSPGDTGWRRTVLDAGPAFIEAMLAGLGTWR